MKKNIVILFFIILILISGCTKKKAEPEKTNNDSPKKIVFYNWEDYIGSDTIFDFEKETGIVVEEVFYLDEEEMLGALQADLSAFDLVVASDDLVREMREARMLAPLDSADIPNLKNIHEDFRNKPYDPENQYGVPYMWGSTGILVNTSFIDPGDSPGWGLLFQQEHASRTAFLNNAFEAFAAAEKFLGYSINETESSRLDEVADLLRTALEGGAVSRDVESLLDLMDSGDLWITQMYSGEGLSAMDENEDLAFFIPAEGAPIWTDIFVIPRDSSSLDEVHQFLNYLMDPEINASIASELWYATANQAAMEYVDEEVLNSQEVYPPDEILAECETFIDIGDVTGFISREWDEMNRQ